MTAGLGKNMLAASDTIGGIAIQGGPAWRPGTTDRQWLGVSLAVLAHLALVVAMVFAVRWQVPSEVAVEAEMWSEIPRAAGPAAVQPPPPVPETKPEPVAKAPLAPEPPVVAKVEAKPDIVVERTPPKKDKPEKVRKEPKEVFEITPPRLSRKDTAKSEPKIEPKPEPKAKPDAKPKPESAQSAAEREALRQANLARMMSELGGGPGGAGRAAASSGPSKSYIGRLIARIKPNIVFTEAINGNPVAQVEVRCAPDGRIVSRKLVASSGVDAWDKAVLRALDRTEVLPLNEQGRIEGVMLLDFRPQDF